MEEIEINEFLKELADLTNKYNIAIGGCGCCGSPFLASNNVEEYGWSNSIYAEKLDYDPESKTYSVADDD